MVLDIITDGKFVFKNTYADKKEYEIAVDHQDAPEEFFFVHIKYKPCSTNDSEPLSKKSRLI